MFLLKFGLLFIIFPNYGFTGSLSNNFPDDFTFGVATSSYQIEGAWNENGKGENIWDKMSHEHPERILDKSNGDIACDSYHKTKEDVALIKNLGVDFYRFSISWSRILPTGYIDFINEDGIRYYNELIDELIRNEIKPIITLYHWDLPQSIHEAGGWTSPFISDYFEDFAWVAFKYFGDRVKMWITINEPYHVCQSGYGSGIFAPGYKSPGYGNYHCAHTLLLAHAKAYHLYDREFRKEQNGTIGITIDSFWYEPKTSAKKDRYAAEMALQINFGLFAHPIFSKKGGFPPLVEKVVAEKSKLESLRRSRLPKFTDEESEFIRGTSDFFGLNHYSTFLVSHSNVSDSENIIAVKDLDAILTQDSQWEATPAFWIKLVPWGLRKLLNKIKDDYGNPIIYITENGMGDDDGRLNDEQRVRYIKQYLGAVLEAIYEDNCRVKAYTSWSLMDNFEWFSGYTLKFGIHSVDFTDPNLKRTAKSSAIYYKNVVKTRNIDHDYVPVAKDKGTISGTSQFLYVIIFIFYTTQKIFIL